jgi:hypothetical protein
MSTVRGRMKPWRLASNIREEAENVVTNSEKLQDVRREGGSKTDRAEDTQAGPFGPAMAMAPTPAGTRSLRGKN